MLIFLSRSDSLHFELVLCFSAKRPDDASAVLPAMPWQPVKEGLQCCFRLGQFVGTI